MKRRALLLLTAGLLLAAGAAQAAPPAVQLLVEWRWVDSSLAPAAQAAVRDGAVVVGTAGSYSPRGPGVVTSTATPPAPPVQRLVVLNGQQAGLRLTTREPLQWVEAVVELDTSATSGPSATSATPGGTRPRIYASPRQGERRSTQGILLTPSWPGGSARVRVAFAVDDSDGGHLQSTVQLPLARWQSVARSSTAAPATPRGTLSTHDAAGQPERELQLRVSVQP
jgi:hypothetical protein